MRQCRLSPNDDHEDDCPERTRARFVHANRLKQARRLWVGRAPMRRSFSYNQVHLALFGSKILLLLGGKQQKSTHNWWKGDAYLAINVAKLWRQFISRSKPLTNKSHYAISTYVISTNGIPTNTSLNVVMWGNSHQLR